MAIAIGLIFIAGILAMYGLNVEVNKAKAEANKILKEAIETKNSAADLFSDAIKRYEQALEFNMAARRMMQKKED